MALDLHYRTLNESATGTPTLVLHGFLGSGDNWLTQSRALDTDGPVYLPDLRNHGQSPHDDTFHYVAMSADLVRFLDDRGISEARVVGHSMGGKAAMFLATQHPERVGKLVVVDIAPRAYPRHHDTILTGLKSVPIDRLQRRQDADAALAAHVPDVGTRQFLLKNLARRPDGGYAWRVNLPVLDRDADRVGEALPDAARYEGPTLFLRGERSDYVRDADLPAIQAHFPQATLQTVAGAGHWLHAERPAETVAALQAFLFDD
ncbi:MAG: alpha/beta fold hydrolase [Catalinimonas sp.]